jgi:hypothetical protein
MLKGNLFSFELFIFAIGVQAFLFAVGARSNKKEQEEFENERKTMLAERGAVIRKGGKGKGKRKFNEDIIIVDDDEEEMEELQNAQQMVDIELESLELEMENSNSKIDGQNAGTFKKVITYNV